MRWLPFFYAPPSQFNEEEEDMRYSPVYDKILRLAKASGMTKRDADAFYAAYEQALESEFDSCRLGCVIICGNTLIAKGHNSEKTSPNQKFYNLRYRDFDTAYYSNREHSLHAEMAALASIPYPVAQQLNWKKSKAYVYRISPGLPHKQGMSAPCCACAHALADAGLRQVFFSTEYGFGSSMLDAGEGLLLPHECDEHAGRGVHNAFAR